MFNIYIYIIFCPLSSSPPHKKESSKRVKKLFFPCLIHHNIPGTHNNAWNIVAIQYIILESMNYSEQSIISGLRNSNSLKYLRHVLLTWSMLISSLENKLLF